MECRVLFASNVQDVHHNRCAGAAMRFVQQSHVDLFDVELVFLQPLFALLGYNHTTHGIQ